MLRTLLLLLACFLVPSLGGYEPHRVKSLPGIPPLRSATYAGYIHHQEGREAYYWFIESERSPKSDPLLLWLNGGPGCSSLLGVLTELGPFIIGRGNDFYRNDFTINAFANILYLESPGIVGFSNDHRYPSVTYDDKLTAEYNYDFLKAWFKLFPEFQSNALYLSGESYAGHYIPQLAYAIYHGSDANIRKHMRGFLVGNPCTGEIGCANADPTLKPFLQYNGFLPLNDTMPHGKGTYNEYDILVPSCASSTLARRVRFPHPVLDAYRQRLRAEPVPFGQCSDDAVTAWLNRKDVQAAIHANSSITWKMCSDDDYTFNYHGVTDIYEELFQKTKWNFMIYSGLEDSVVNHVQTQTVVNGMKHRLFDPSRGFEPWNYPDNYVENATQFGGFYIQYDRFSYAEVRDAGHMVPQTNSVAAQELFRSFFELGKPGRL